MHVYLTQATAGTARQIELQLPGASPVGRAIIEVRFPDTTPDQQPILAIPRHQAPALPATGGCWPVADLGFMHPPLWRERAQVEHDETLLQPVAYGVLFNEAGDVWCYQRAGGDSRVNGRLSCGVGGHVDAPDAIAVTPAATSSAISLATAAAPDTFDPEATLRRAWLRELSEELLASPLHLTDVRMIGLVYEGQSAIGRVHLGVVFGARWVAPEPPRPAAGEALSSQGFLPLTSIVADDRFELWSRLVAGHLLCQASTPNTFST